MLSYGPIPWEPPNVQKSCFQEKERRQEIQGVVPALEQLQDQPKQKKDS